MKNIKKVGCEEEWGQKRKVKYEQEDRLIKNGLVIQELKKVEVFK